MIRQPERLAKVDRGSLLSKQRDREGVRSVGIATGDGQFMLGVHGCVRFSDVLGLRRVVSEPVLTHPIDGKVRPEALKRGDQLGDSHAATVAQEQR